MNMYEESVEQLVFYAFLYEVLLLERRKGRTVSQFICDEQYEWLFSDQVR